MKRLLLRIYAKLSPNYRRLQRVEVRLESLQDALLRGAVPQLSTVIDRMLRELRGLSGHTVNVRRAQEAANDHVQRELQALRETQGAATERTHRELRALNEYEVNRDKTNPTIVREIMATGASFPTIIGKASSFFGQLAEDLLVESILAALMPERLRNAEMRYLDIGSNHPISTSNTYRFYKRGMRGVLVEPIPELAHELRRVRSEDVVLEVGAKFDERTEATLFVCDHHEISSFEREFIADFIRRNEESWEIVKTVKVPMVSVNDIMQEHFGAGAPDFLSVDVESMDYEILASIDYEHFRPGVICVEPSDDFVKPSRFASNSARIGAFMSSAGYVLVARTRINQIFVSRALLEARDTRADSLGDTAVPTFERSPG